jgi:hypothetical protein
MDPVEAVPVHGGSTAVVNSDETHLDWVTALAACLGARYDL